MYYLLECIPSDKKHKSLTFSRLYFEKGPGFESLSLRNNLIDNVLCLQKVLPDVNVLPMYYL